MKRRKFNGINKEEKPLFWWLLVALLLFFAILAGRGAFNIFLKEKESKERLGIVKEEYDELTERKGFLEEDIKRLETPFGVEEEIRDKFGLGKDGESVVVVVNSEDDDNAGQTGGFRPWEWLKSLFK